MKRARVDVTAYVPLIAQQARIAWSYLPEKTRTWISPEDLIQEGLIVAKYHVAKKHDPKKSKFSTYLTNTLKCFYADVVSEYKAQCRNQNKENSMEAMSLHFTGTDWERCLGTAIHSHEPSPDTSLKVAYGLAHMYLSSSDALKTAMVSWFFPEGEKKFRTVGRRFDALKEELLTLSPQFGIGEQELRFLFTSPDWQDLFRFLVAHPRTIVRKSLTN
jgi:hypothetical protein